MTNTFRLLTLTAVLLGGLLSSCGDISDVQMDVVQDAAETDVFTTVEPTSEEQYNAIYENDWLEAKEFPLSTFGVDVDMASYSNVRRFLTDGTMPNKDAVRIEEMINYFDYDYKQPTDEHPFSVTTEVASCPWNPDARLAMIGLKGKNVKAEDLPPANFVFLVDVSGSMSDAAKLPLLKQSLMMLTKELRPDDRVAIVTYAGNAGLVLESTPGSAARAMRMAINEMEAGGSTAGGAGIQLAYKVALENATENSNNRVILCTDGDFNVGISDQNGLVRMIEKRRKQGVFLSVLGFGTGNYQDGKMEQLADNGNGNYAYIDNITEAKKVLVTEMSSTMFTIAKDVKLQLAFNDMAVEKYRLIGYENRVLNDEDFDNDEKDSGDMGAGHEVTALYEVIPASSSTASVDASGNAMDELFTVDLRYKQPQADKSVMLTTSTNDSKQSFAKASENMRWASSVAGFGMMLRDSKHKGSLTYSDVKNLAQNAKGEDAKGYRSEMLRLIDLAETFASDPNPEEE